MISLAEKLEPSADVIHTIGTVHALRDGLWSVRTADGGEVDARRAVSCLVQPRPTDGVLVAGSEAAGWFILAILTREDGVGVTLTADGDMTLRAPTGVITLAAKMGLDLLSETAMRVAASQLDIRAGEGNIVLRSLAYVGDALQAEVDRVKLFSRTLDSVLDRVSQRVKRSFRIVDEMDVVRAEQMDYVAEQTMHLRADTALVTARQLVKLDGEQVHIG